MLRSVSTRSAVAVLKLLVLLLLVLEGSVLIARATWVGLELVGVAVVLGVGVMLLVWSSYLRRVRHRRRELLFWLPALLLATLPLPLLFDTSRTPELWELPDGYRGWVIVEYGRPDCPPLPRIDDHLLYRISPDGRLCTSERHPFGIALDRYEYLAADGTRRQLDHTEVRKVFSLDRDSLFVFIGSAEEQQRAPRPSFP